MAHKPVISRTRFTIAGATVAVAAALGLAHVACAQETCIVGAAHEVVADDAVIGELFGLSVSIDGDVVIAGASADNKDVGSEVGSAYVYRFDGEQWGQETKLTASDAIAEDRFGLRVAVDGDVVVVGADSRDDLGLNSGAAYVFRFDGEQWIEETKLLADDGAESAFFGWWVAICENVVVVGASGDDDAANDAGAAYVFRYNGRSWVQEAKLMADDAASGDKFGRSVDVDDDLIIVGAEFADAGASNTGAAYIFRNTGREWVQEVKLTASDGAFHDQLGVSVSISGDVALAGAHWESPNDLVVAGSAYAFRYDGEQWSEEQKIIASDAEVSDFFGISVSVVGDHAVIGAFRDDDACPESPNCDSGSAYVFQYDGAQWIEKAKLVPADTFNFDQFGFGVDIGADAIVVGAIEDDDGGLDSGSAYIFRGLADCNTNDELDFCDIADGVSDDANDNDVPDECETLLGDLDGDGDVDATDLIALLGAWGPCDDCADCPADLDDDCSVGTGDLIILLGNWG